MAIELSLSINGPRALRTVCDLMGNNTLSSGKPVGIPGGATLTFQPTDEKRSFGAEAAAVTVILAFLPSITPIAQSLISSYIFDRMSKHKGNLRLTINRRTTIIEDGQIRRVIEEEIKKYQ